MTQDDCPRPTPNGGEPGTTQPTERKLTGQLRGLIPFKKGPDPRRNMRGTPRSFEQFRVLAQQIARKVILTKDGRPITVGEAILRSWAKSKEPQLQRAFIEYAFGKVPDKLDTSLLDSKTTLILHYGHEREKRDQEHRRLSADLPPGAD